MARRGVGGVVAVWPSVWVVGGARLSYPVEVIVSLLLPAATVLLKVTQVCKHEILQNMTQTFVLVGPL